MTGPGDSARDDPAVPLPTPPTLAGADQPVELIDTSRAHPARRYDYWLGGKDNFAADRVSGNAIESIYPYIRTAAVQNRRFLRRAVRYLVTETGVRQFLDVGTGLPSADNTHEVAQRVDPYARIVYVDNDPLVLVHARALLAGTPEGATAYLRADLREPATILTHPGLAATLDLKQPVALLLVAILHFVDTPHAYTVVRALIDALAPGSYLVLSHATLELLPAGTSEKLATTDYPGKAGFTARTRAQITPFFDGLDLIEPGLTVVSQWRPEPGDTPPPPQQVSVYGAVAHKPRPGGGTAMPTGRTAGRNP